MYPLKTTRTRYLSSGNANVHYLSDNVRLEVDVSDEKLKEARAVIHNAVQGIKNRNFRRYPSEHCEECDFNRICSKRA